VRGALVQIDGQPVQEPRQVALPYHWDQLHPGQSGRAVFSVEWEALPEPGTVKGLYLSRVGNVFTVRLNGQRLTQDSQLVPAGSDWGKVPHWVGIPSALLALHNRLDIEIRVDRMRKGGLGVFWLGL
jgi:hypothetical protein